MHIIQPPLFDFEQFIMLEKQERLIVVLEALDAEKLLDTLERERWTGRRGYSFRGMWAALIAGLLTPLSVIPEVGVSKPNPPALETTTANSALAIQDIPP